MSRAAGVDCGWRRVCRVIRNRRWRIRHRSRRATGTRTPIKHLIVVVGENYSFDNVCNLYASQPHSARNLLSLDSQSADCRDLATLAQQIRRPDTTVIS
jgi:hypothetical protein